MRRTKATLSILILIGLCLSILGCSSTISSNSASYSSDEKTITIAARDGSHADVINSVKGKFES
ncbi:MAG: hypothetical protein J6N21_15715, partial [Butyrivibrio sp.]|nr:hypothetical protein [Butyrivibrio sp.]